MLPTITQEKYDLQNSSVIDNSYKHNIYVIARFTTVTGHEINFHTTHDLGLLNMII